MMKAVKEKIAGRAARWATFVALACSLILPGCRKHEEGKIPKTPGDPGEKLAGDRNNLPVQPKPSVPKLPGQPQEGEKQAR